jgi:hypothetical protein
MNYRVLVKPSNPYQAWTSRGVYGSESAALAQAQRLAKQYAFVRVVDGEGQIVWNG